MENRSQPVKDDVFIERVIEKEADVGEGASISNTVAGGVK